MHFLYQYKIVKEIYKKKSLNISIYVVNTRKTVIIFLKLIYFIHQSLKINMKIFYQIIIVII